MQEITSRQNKNYKIWLQCLESKGVQMHQRAILAGKKVMIDTLSHHKDKVIAVLVPKDQELSSILRDVEVFSLEEKLFNELDVFGTHEPLLVVKVPDPKPWKEEQISGCALWLGFQDPRNVGAVLRSAAALGVRQIILGPGCANPFHPASSRAASGAVFEHHYFLAKSIPDNLPTVALDMHGDDLRKFKFPKNFILVPGVEGPGVDKNFKPNFRVTIPISKSVESLNAATATSIALYEWAKNL